MEYTQSDNAISVFGAISPVSGGIKPAGFSSLASARINLCPGVRSGAASASFRENSTVGIFAAACTAGVWVRLSNDGDFFSSSEISPKLNPVSSYTAGSSALLFPIIPVTSCPSPFKSASSSSSTFPVLSFVPHAFSSSLFPSAA